MHKIVIIGGGPTGLGAAYHLYELGHENWTIYEKEGYLGGHAASFTDAKGFVWDEGVHVFFSHYPYFNKLLDTLLGKEYLEHGRETWIRISGMWVPYPFQNNIGRLPKDMLMECIMGLIDAHAMRMSDRSSNFRDWIEAVFGKGIAKHFMFPYNFKVWATPLELMNWKWIGERVSVVDIQKVLENVIYKIDDVVWGPNNTFKFPLYGGAGEVYRRIEPYIAEHLQYHKELIEVDINKKELRFSDGTIDWYDELITSIPLDIFCQMVKPVTSEVKEKSDLLKHNSLIVIGLGLKKKQESKKSWMYFPDDNTSFYRAYVFSNYSPYNVPEGDIEKYSSIICENSYSQYKPEEKKNILQKNINGLIDSGILTQEDQRDIISIYQRDVKYAYPIPTLERDTALQMIQPFLERHGIYSRGRFGGWKYEIGNMDHSIMQGMEVVDRILLGKPETIYTVD